MNTQKSLFKALSICFVYFLYGCTATVNFSYPLKNPPAIENKVISNATIYFSMEDLRNEPSIIGYLENALTVKPIDLDISKSIYLKYKEEFAKNGFLFSDNVAESDLTLTLSITTLLGEMRPGVTVYNTVANCFMKATLVSSKDNTELFSTNFWGIGERKSMFPSKNGIIEALYIALDDILNKILSETELINAINNFNKP
jgi:hypothetical protein